MTGDGSDGGGTRSVCQVEIMEVSMGGLLLWWNLVRFLSARLKLQGGGRTCVEAQGSLLVEIALS